MWNIKLSDEEVQKRTDVTVKMANVAGESADTVSEWMTSIWNNFAEGSDNLEHYADVMTALGATTASSSAEIAEGIEKFAAVGDTVGLSYEYAASALATVTAETRQSADVVGNAFKTLFARIQDLELGETLDDGTTLGTYAQSLEKVGINIKDQQGNLKDMDDILEELGAKWQTIAKDELVALAENLAGVRQYTQLISLMDNWDKFLENLQTAYNSDGTLQELADIYAESWEAARDRVTAAAEAIYSDLIDDDFFITILDGLAGILKTIDKIIDSVGGLPGILTAIGAIVFKMANNSVATKLTNLGNSIKSFASGTDPNETKKDVWKVSKSMVLDASYYGAAKANSIDQEASIQEALLDNAKNMTEEQRKIYALRLDSVKALLQQAEASAKSLDKLEEETELLKEQAKLRLEVAAVKNKKKLKNLEQDEENIDKYADARKRLGIVAETLDPLKNTLSSVLNTKLPSSGVITNVGQLKTTLNSISQTIADQGVALDDVTSKEFEQILAKVKEWKNDGEDLVKLTDDLKAELGKILTVLGEITATVRKETAAVEATVSDKKGNMSEKVEEIGDTAEAAGRAAVITLRKMDSALQSADKLIKDIEKSSLSIANWAQGLTSAVLGVSSIAMGVSSLSALFSEFEEVTEKGSLSLGDFAQMVMSLSMGLTTLYSGIKAIGSITVVAANAETKEEAITLAQAAAKKVFAKATLSAEASMALFVAAVAAAIVVVAGIIAIYNKFFNTQKQFDKSNEKLQESIETWKDYQSQVESIESEIESLQELLEELNAIEAPTFADELEIQKLEKEIELLQQSKELKEAQEAKAKQEVLDDFNANKASYDKIVANSKYSTYTGNTLETRDWESNFSNVSLSDIDFSDQLAIEDYKQALENYVEANPLAKSSEAYGYITNALDNWADKQLAWLDDINARGETAAELLPELTKGSLEYIDAVLANSNMLMANGTAGSVANRVYSKFTEKDQEKIRDATNEDGTLDLDALGEYPDLLRRVSNYANESGLTLDDFASSINTVAAAAAATAEETTKSFTDLQTAFKTVHDIIDDLSLGDTISSDDYSNLSKEALSYFTMMIDGTYKLTASAEDLLAVIAESEKQDFLATKQLLVDKYNASINAKNTGYDLDTLSSSLARTDGGAASADVIRALIQLLQDLNGENETYDNWLKQLNTEHTMLNSDLNDIADAVYDCIGLYESLDETLEDNYNQLLQLDLAYAEQFDNFEDLRKAFDEGTISAEAYNTALIQLDAEKDIENLDADELSEFAKYLQKTAKSSDLLADSLADDDKAAKIVAKSIMKMNDGIEDLADNFSDWKSVIKDSTSSAEEYSKAMTNLRDATSNVLDISSEFISDDFLKTHLEEIGQAATGDADAIDNLKLALRDDIVANIIVNNELDSEEITSKVAELLANLDSLDLSVGGIDTESFIDSCNELISTAHLTADLANALFDSMGFEALFKEESEPIITKVPIYQTTHKIVNKSVETLEDGTKVPTWVEETSTELTGEYEPTGAAAAYAMTTDGSEPKVESVIKKPSASYNDYSSSNKGGKSLSSGSSSSSTATKKDLTKDKSTRYTKITEAIDDLTRSVNNLNKAESRLYGADRIKAMKDETAELLKLKEATELKLAEAEEYLKKDKSSLEGFGYTLDFDSESGNLNNYDEVMALALADVNAAENYYNSLDKDALDAWADKLEEAQNKYSDFIDAYEQYDETNDLIEDLKDTAEEIVDTWQQRNYDIIEYEMELREDLLEREIKLIDTEISILGDSFYKMAEVGTLYKSLFPTYEEGLQDADIKYQKAQAAYAVNEINQEQYIELLQESQDAIIDNINSILDLDSTMTEYYSKTIKAGQDELSKYTDLMDNLNKVLEHYNNLLNLTGRAKDYKSINAILQSQYKTTKNLYEIEKANYEDLQARTDRLKQQLENDDLGEKEREMIQGEYDDLVTYTAEAQEKMYSYLEELGDEAASIFSNTMDEIREKFESSLSDAWSSFDDLNTLIERLTTSQEEYLTKTNLLYETNKLIRQATQDMNTVENKLSKQRYNDYIQYIQKLQDSNKLTQADLEIAQAKYEVLQALIALEDALSSKSTVRMTKDNEGNWGYVYTADLNDIDEKQQEYDDAVNNLYNLSLEGMLNYQSKIAQAMLDAYSEQEEITKAYQSGEIATWDEYQLKLLESREYWFNYMEDLYDEYYAYEDTMIEYSSQGYKDYTTANISSIDEFREAYNQSMLEQMLATEDWEDDVDYLTDEVGEDFDETKKKVDNVTDASEDLNDYVQGTLLGTMLEEYNAVENLCDEYADLRDAIYEVVNAYLAEAEAILKVLALLSTGSSSSSSSHDYSIDMVNAIIRGDDDALESASSSRVTKTGGVYEGIYNDEEVRAAGQAIKDAGYKSAEEYLLKYGVSTLIAAAKAGGVSFDTGGYTGSWGPEGKLATVHERELILNKDDASTFIDTTNRLASISSLLDTLASSSFLGLGDLLSGVSADNSSTLQQEVHIEANFPNATDKSEIEGAFENLINLASQYANRKV